MNEFIQYSTECFYELVKHTKDFAKTSGRVFVVVGVIISIFASLFLAAIGILATLVGIFTSLTLFLEGLTMVFVAFWVGVISTFIAKKTNKKFNIDFFNSYD